ncbi:hypothetical protein N2152v2_004439 [Parachlorella kessleri]
MASIQQARLTAFGAQLQVRKILVRPLPAGRVPVRQAAFCSAQASSTRRQALQLGTLLAAAPLLPPAASAAKAPRGFVPVKDTQDGYEFLYPFGWQEIAIDGQDVVFKDVIEPLESVSVNLLPTDKTDISEYGPLDDVVLTLADKVLTGPSQEVKIITANERMQDGRRYYDFEFTAKTRNYTRRALASVTVGNGKFYTLLTGANERRWGKMQDKVETVLKSFEVFNVY